MAPKVTIGVCVRNSAATIHGAIESICTQDFAHEFIEIIFVDDGSHDETLSIINRCLPKIDFNKTVIHNEWRGLGPSRNLVVERADSDYIVWVDGDMIIPKDHVRKQIDFMDHNPKVGIAKARYGNNLKEGLIGTLENSAYLAVDQKYGGRVTSRGLGTGGSIYRVEAIRQAGGFEEEIKGAGEDISAELRVRRAGWLTYLGTPAVFLERRRNSWKDLWKEYSWQGYGYCRAYKKNGNSFALYKLTPIGGFLAAVYYSTIAYPLTCRKVVFLLPIQYVFKRIAWSLGFIKCQLSARSEGHRRRNREQG